MLILAVHRLESRHVHDASCHSVDKLNAYRSHSHLHDDSFIEARQNSLFT